MKRSLHTFCSWMRRHLSALDPHRRNVKNRRRKNQHLQNRSKPDTGARNDWHAGCVLPSLQEVDGNPFNRHSNNQSTGQHHAIALGTRMNEPARSPESDPPCSMNDPENDAVPQARDETMPPHARPAIQANIQRGLSDFPGIVQCNGDDKYRCEIPKRVDAIRAGFQGHCLMKGSQKWKSKAFLYSMTLA